MQKMSKTQIETLLGSCTPRYLRAIISRAAVHTPGVIYASGDIDPAGRDTVNLRGILPALTLLAAHGDKELHPGDELEIKFVGMTHAEEEKYGDWVVTIELTSHDIYKQSDTVPGEDDLISLPSDEIRTILSDLATKTPATVYINENFAQDHDPKTINDGSELSPVAQSAMFMCSSLRSLLDAEQSWKTTFTAMKHGTGQATVWTIEVTRDSL